MNCASRPVPRTPNVEVLQGVKCLTSRSSRRSRRSDACAAHLFRYVQAVRPGVVLVCLFFPNEKPKCST